MRTPVLEDTRTYMEKFSALMAAGESLDLPVWGNSMNPFLVHGRDRVRLQAPNRPLKTGDIALYRRENGDYILHRICAVKDGCYTMVGDAQTHREWGIRPDQIIAVALWAERKGRVQRPGSFWWEFFARIWVRIIPLRPGLVRLYLLLRRHI